MAAIKKHIRINLLSHIQGAQFTIRVDFKVDDMMLKDIFILHCARPGMGISLAKDGRTQGYMQVSKLSKKLRRDIVDRFRLTDNDFWKQVDAAIGSKSGVYKLFCLIGDRPVAVPRIGGTDNEGILYIGMAVDNRYRLGPLKRSLDPAFNDRNAHSVGKRYHSHAVIQSTYPVADLYVSIKTTNSQSEAGDLERQELDAYEKMFGELPPFNRQG